MNKYPIPGGAIPAPVKVVLYGVEGIGKSSLAARFPGAVFIDTEGGTKRLDVRRLPAPTSWQMLTEEVAAAAAGGVDCQTLVLDTADWAEKLCMAAVCQRLRVKGIEDIGYGKGYTYVKEDFARLRQALGQVTLGPCPAFPPPPEPPEQAVTLRQALFSPGKDCPLNQAEGKIAASPIAPYPPGVPIVAPGERISKKTIAYLDRIGYNNGCRICV